MQYRVCFLMGVFQYYTEWFETVAEAREFVDIANETGQVYPTVIEDSDGEVI